MTEWDFALSRLHRYRPGDPGHLVHMVAEATHRLFAFIGHASRFAYKLEIVYEATYHQILTFQ